MPWLRIEGDRERASVGGCRGGLEAPLSGIAPTVHWDHFSPTVYKFSCWPQLHRVDPAVVIPIVYF